MDIIKILFATFFTVVFLGELLEENKTAKAILCIIAYFFFILIVANRQFF